MQRLLLILIFLLSFSVETLSTQGRNFKGTVSDLLDKSKSKQLVEEISIPKTVPLETPVDPASRMW